jgi:Nif-specific regulatory protein
MDLERLIPFVVSKTRDLLDAEGSAVLLLDEERGELYFPYSADVDSEVERRFAAIRFPADRGIAGWVVQKGIPQLVPDVAKDPRWYGKVDRQSGMVTQSLLCAPLRTRRGTLGVIELRNRLDGEFTAEDLEFLAALAGSIAVAIENARLYQQVKESEARLRDEIGVLHRDMVTLNRFSEIVGKSEEMRRVFQLMESAITTPVNVLLQGETGTGKEIIARAIHYHGPRKDRPFVAVNCGALSEALLESELFGHKRGSFTGAVADKRGLFEVADGGTVLLDEVGETSAAMQVKLLRAVENGEILPVGETHPRVVDVRLISATHRDIELESRKGRFRQDLYYRLSTFPIDVPPLRERAGDIPLLAAHILKRTAKKFRKSLPGFTAAALDAFAAYAWPGNVRELENEIERAAAIVPAGELIRANSLSDKLNGRASGPSDPTFPPSTLRHAREQFERQFIGAMLRRFGGNVTHTAKALGMSRGALQVKVARFRLNQPAGARGARRRRPLEGGD